MALTEEANTSPDLYDLEETFMTDVHTEIIGSNVRVIIGVDHGGRTHWLRSAVCPAARLMEIAQKCYAAACEATGGGPKGH